ncbi:MAG: hypothetical protein ACWA5A_02880 [Marinibacterium sp.]
MGPGRICAAMLLAVLAAGNVAADGAWTASTDDLGARIYGSAYEPGRSLTFNCTAPSPQGRDPIETGEHEENSTGPNEMFVGFRNDLFTWPDNLQIDGAVMYLGNTGYRLPPIHHDELSGTAVLLPMTDQMVLALFDAPSLILDTGQGVAYQYPIEGLGAAVQTALAYCAARWAQLGHAVPPQLARLGASMPAIAAPVARRSATLPAGYRLAPLLPLPATPPAAGVQHLTTQCQGRADTDPAYIQSADIDGDGLQDYVLNWSGVTCHGGVQGRTQCGAANCRIDVFLSRRNYANPEELFGIAADVVLDTQGRIGVLLSGTNFVCADGFCDSPFYWNGTRLAQ